MLTSRDLSHINSLRQLKREKRKAEAEIEEAERRLEMTFSGLPGRALGGAVGMVAGAVVKGIQNHFAQQEEVPVPEPESFAETLKSVGSETALFALSKLVERFLGQR